MAGAMAGSAILDSLEPSDGLKLLTLTVNNSCNLECPHCYLQYASSDEFVSEAVVQRVMESNCTRLAIVGKEPLMTAGVAQQSWQIMRRAVEAGKRVSFITNGVGLDYLPDEAAAVIDFIDVSFDGGPRTYQAYRGPSYAKLVDRIGRCVGRGFCRFRALSVLSSATVDAIEDILMVAELDDIELLMLSPYIPTRNDGRNTVLVEPIGRLIERLGDSKRFRDSEKVVLLIARHELDLLGEKNSEVVSLIEALGLRQKVAFVDRDPLELGVLRVTYEGFAMTPLESLHPAEYHRVGVRVADASIDGIYARLRANMGAAAHHAN
jgi:MoaA/NifB/PqqE/SkfB family radical SAM enzyme